MAQKACPITPQQALITKKESIPDAVIECFNEEIARQLRGETAWVRKCDIEALINRVMPGCLIDPSWFNIEDIYGEAGWRVVYSFPTREYEDFPPGWLFTPK